MSGKSTFLRTVGVTSVMAQTLNTCLAAAHQAPSEEIVQRATAYAAKLDAERGATLQGR